MGDQNGYTLEWGANEKNALIQLPAGVSVADAKYPFDGVADDDNLTITVGT